jgi:hypothetical protein
VVDSSIKYGQGPEVFREMLKVVSDSIAEVEALEYNLRRLRADDIKPEVEEQLVRIEGKIAERKKAFADACDNLKFRLEQLKKGTK